MVEEKLGVEPEKIQIALKDSRAIEIVRGIPKERFDEIIEKYIILGYTVVSYASVTTTAETVETFFAPLRGDIETIREQLKIIVPTMAKPAERGAVTVESLFKSYEEHFRDDTFEDVSAIGKYADIKATPAGLNRDVLIETKEYSSTVPTTEVEKFWRDMELRDTQYGIFVSMRTGIAKISGEINVVSRGNRTAVFVVNEKLGWTGHLFAYYVVKKLIEHEALMTRGLKEEELTKVITKVNMALKGIRDDVKIVEEIRSVAEGLKTTTRSKLEKIIEHAEAIKKRVDEKIDEAFREIAKAEIESSED